jgi:riboflavin synthase
MENPKPGNLNQKKTNFGPMFTGIIEATGVVKEVVLNGSNRTFRISSPISSLLKPDQSVAHNGVCLTVENINADEHQVTAIQETLTKTTLGNWQKGDIINLERCLQMNGRIDGHIVQGHVDATGECLEIKNLYGSWEVRISFPQEFAHLIVEKGSVCLDGVSLTAFNISQNVFTLGIIPYTFQNTNLGRMKKGNSVNLEFDVIGKYVSRHMHLVESQADHQQSN